MIQDKIMNLNLKSGDLIRYEGKIYKYGARFPIHGITVDRCTDLSNGEFYDFCGEEEIIICGNVEEIE